MQIVVRTAKRNKSYLWDTLTSIRQEFPADAIHITAEPGSLNPRDYPSYNVIINNTQLGIIDNFINGVRYVLQFTSAQWFMMCEDDIAFLPGSGDKIRDALVYYDGYPDLGFLSPYCALSHGSPSLLGWDLFGTQALCGLLCVILHRSTAGDIVASYERATRGVSIKTANRSADSAFGKVIQAQNLQAIGHCPTLVTHTGEVSSIVDTATLPPRLLLNRRPYLDWHTTETCS
jgi:hypothetical protein